MAIINMFLPIPQTMEGLYEIVEDYFPGLCTRDIKAMTAYIKSTTDYNMLIEGYPEMTIYEQEFCEWTHHYWEAFLDCYNLNLAFTFVSGLGLTEDGVQTLLEQKAWSEFPYYSDTDWSNIPEEYLKYFWEVLLEEYPPVDKDPATKDEGKDEEDEAEQFFNAPRISREQYLHRRHRAGHNHDVARHGWQGQHPLKYANGKAYNHECKARALNASQHRLEKEAWK